jgi:hypothetical protein
MSGPAPARNDPIAHEVLRAAHLQAYRFPEGFGGFSAELTYEDPATRTVGAVAVRAPRDVLLELDAGPEVQAWITRELGMMAGHRWPADYEAGDGRYRLGFEGETSDPRGRLVRFYDDPMGSSYRVREGRIVQVNRQMGETRFSINVLEHVQTTDGRLLPTYFIVAYWDAAGRLTHADAYTDRFAVVQGVVLPESRRVLTCADDGVTVRELTLTDLQLLPTPAAAP